MIAALLCLALTISPSAATPEVTVRTIVGKATWFDASKNSAWYTQPVRQGAARRNQQSSPYKFYAAAGPRMRELAPFKWGAEPYRVIITNKDNGRSIVVWVVDVCQCREGKNEKLIDLSPAAFQALGVPLHHGVQKVVAEILTPYYYGGR
jgi:hypothetical protein